MKKIAMALLGLTLIPSCQMDPTLSGSMEKASTLPVAEDVEAFVQALKDENFEQAQSMLQDGKISVNEKVDISTVSELAEVRSAHQVAALLPLQVAAYWGDESLIKLIWEQDPDCYTKQDINLALELAMSGENYDARAGLLSIVSENFSDADSSHAPDADSEVPARTALATMQKDAEGDTGTMQKDEHTGTMQKDEHTGTMQKDEHTGTMQKDEYTGTMQKDEHTGTMQKDEHTGTMQKDTE